MTSEFYVLITQYDTDATGVGSAPPKGPIVHEGYLMNFKEAQARARQLAGKYGWSVIAPVNVDGLRPMNQEPEDADV